MSKYINHVISTQNEQKTSGFGKRVRNGREEMHKGLDVVDANRKEKTSDVYVLAFADGTVVLAKDYPYTSSDCGNYVDIAHEIPSSTGGKKWLTRYMHMRNNSVRVKTGQTVKKGDILGIVGTSGDSSGIHLHFQINEDGTNQRNGTPVDPEPFLLGERSFGSPQTDAKPPIKAQAKTQSAAFKAGYTVRIKSTAEKYVNSDILIPDRYKTSGYTDTVHQVSKDGNSVLLAKIWSWVWAKDCERA